MTSATPTRRDADAYAAPPPRHPFYDQSKRILDCLIAGGVLVVLSPLWLAIAVAIRLTSPGPAIYSRKIIGRRGVPFTYYKFRTMTHGNDDSAHRAFLEAYVKENKPFTVERDAVTGEERPVYKVVGDTRVTKIGAILRNLSLDEVPQLVNVLRGEMSIVGPRPPVEHEFALYDRATLARLAVLPGITGLAQTRGRGRYTFAEMVAVDLEYVRKRSLLLDIKIMLATAGAMRKGA